MAGPTKLLEAHGLQKLGTRKPVVTVIEEDKARGTWAGRRLLGVNGRSAFELSFWCGTCPLLFERLEPSAEKTVSIPELQETLNNGLTTIDESVIDAFSALLPKGKYLPMLLEIEPTLVEPGQPGDYFAEEQHATWRDAEEPSSSPENPHTPYYRADTRTLDGDDRLFEFVVPIVPPSWNERDHTLPSRRPPQDRSGGDVRHSAPDPQSDLRRQKPCAPHPDRTSGHDLRGDELTHEFRPTARTTGPTEEP